jgi:hypothetical protein
MLGTCAGMIMLDRDHLGILDVRAERNAFGRQLHSFEADLEIAGVPGGPVHAVFIRAPWVQEHGPASRCSPRSTASGRVRQGNVIALSFHPELTGETRLHELLLEEGTCLQTRVSPALDRRTRARARTRPNRTRGAVRPRRRALVARRAVVASGRGRRRGRSRARARPRASRRGSRRRRRVPASAAGSASEASVPTRRGHRDDHQPPQLSRSIRLARRPHRHAARSRPAASTSAGASRSLRPRRTSPPHDDSPSHKSSLNILRSPARGASCSR